MGIMSRAHYLVARNPNNSTMACFRKRFHLTPMDKRVHDTVFEVLGPQDGLLSEEKVNSFLSVRLDNSTIDKIWEVSDQDKDGFLDRYEWPHTWLSEQFIMMKRFLTSFHLPCPGRKLEIVSSLHTRAK